MKAQILILLGMLVSSTAFARDVEVNITSWQKIDPYRSAELCGQVTGSFTGNEKILITVDPGKHEGEYVTFVSPKGNFCQIVSAFTGKVKVEVVGSGSAIKAVTTAERFP